MLLSIVVPSYNEEDSIPLFFQEVEKIRPQIGIDLEYIFVDDGSQDKTLEVLRNLGKDKKEVRYLSFSRNFGKESAMLAGLYAAKGQYVVIMDADLQHPPSLLLEMKKRLDANPNLDCVGARRLNRKGEPIVRSFLSNLFYRIVNKMSSVEIQDNAGDYRMMKRNMVDSILEVSEYNRFSKGIFSWVGYRTDYVDYENVERVAGTTKWNFSSLLAYSLEGLINFSETPLNIATYMGIIYSVISFIMIIYTLINTIFFGEPVAGYPTLLIMILLIGGGQFMSLGILGKYIGKIFMETKRRPHYFIKEEKD